MSYPATQDQSTFDLTKEQYAVWRELGFNTKKVIEELLATRLAVTLMCERMKQIGEVPVEKVDYSDNTTRYMYDAAAIDVAALGSLDVEDDELEEEDDLSDEDNLAAMEVKYFTKVDVMGVPFAVEVTNE